MNSYPSVSVIVATYNRDHSLVRCLRSAINQDFAGEMEIIVVDQTRQHSQEVLDFFQHHREKITRIEQQEPNLPKARNAGIAAARGGILFFVDDDIILPSQTLERLARHFHASQPRGVAGVVVSESNPEASLRDVARQLGVASLDEGQQAREVERFIGALMMVSANAVRRVGGFDERLGRLTPTAYGEDDDFCYRLRQAGIPLWIDPSVRVLHKDRLAGGCGSRRTDPSLARKYHMKSMVYIRLKHHGRMGAGGWLQLGRAYVINREFARSGPREALRNFSASRTAICEVRAFMAQAEPEGRGRGTLRYTTLERNALRDEERTCGTRPII